MTTVRGLSWALAIVLAMIAPHHATAETVSREQDVIGLRLGQRIQVDDGLCPAGQIKEVSGAQLSAAGVVRVIRCVPRQGAKR